MTFSLLIADVKYRSIRWHRSAAMMFGLIAIFAVGQTNAIGQQKMMANHAGHGKMMASKKLAYDGYCSVCVVEKQKWVKGNDKISAKYDGQTYLFPSENEKKVFLKNPAKYAPALGGDCIVCKVHVNKMVPGSVKFAAFYNKRVFLFPSQKEKDVFVKSPKKYADADIAINGMCAICLTHGKKVKGKTDHTVVHNKMRYLFPEATLAANFAKNPKEVLMKLKK